MDNKCPKCGRKLSLFYVKPECPNCGCDINYYDYENRLEQDAIKAEAEFAWVEDKLNKFVRPILNKFKKKKKKVKKAAPLPKTRNSVTKKPSKNKAKKKAKLIRKQS